MTDAGEQRARLVGLLRAEGALTSDAVADAFAAVPRECFLPDVPLDEVYLDRAFVTRWLHGVPVSSSSQPAVMAVMLEQLEVRPGDHVLEIGAGTGYNAALLARLVGPRGQVTSVELDAATADGAARQLAVAGATRAAVVTADGVLGAPASAPFDRIIATASAREIPPAWIAQLRPGGRLVLPFRLNHCQVIVTLDRAGQDLVSVSAAGGAFMPLRSGELDSFAVVLPDGARATADVPLDDVLLASVVEHERDTRPVTLPVPDGERGYAAFVFVALQGAPIYAIERWAGESLVAESRVLVTSAQSALRWPLVPGGEEPEALGSDEALDFVRAALMRWRLAGEPGVERLRMRVTPAGGAGVLSALPRPISGAYRFARGAHAYELRFATA